MLARSPKANHVKLTDKLIAKLPVKGQPGFQPIWRDTEVKGFFIVSARDTWTFTAQADAFVDGKRKSFKQTFRRFGDPGVDTTSARGQAEDFIRGIQLKSRLPKQEEPGPTLREAWSAYRKDLILRGKQPGTIEFYQDIIEKGPLKSWLDTHLRDFGKYPKKVGERHEKITKESGRYRANGAMRTFSAVYRYALVFLDTTLPPAPKVRMNKETESSGGFDLSGVAAFGDQVRKMQNPIRREFNAILLYTGSRPAALASLRWTDIDWRERSIHFANPKGGPARHFYLPISKPIRRALFRVRRAGQYLFPGSPFVFPAESKSGALSEWKESRDQLASFGRDLRRAFRTICDELEIYPPHSKLLMNHATDVSDVHERYKKRDPKSPLAPRVRASQERVSAAIEERLGRLPDIRAQLREEASEPDGAKPGRPGIVQRRVQEAGRVAPAAGMGRA